MALEMKQNVPDIYMDPSYETSMHFNLSTSQVSWIFFSLNFQAGYMCSTVDDWIPSNLLCNHKLCKLISAVWFDSVTAVDWLFFFHSGAVKMRKSCLLSRCLVKLTYQWLLVLLFQMVTECATILKKNLYYLPYQRISVARKPTPTDLASTCQSLCAPWEIYCKKPIPCLPNYSLSIFARDMPRIYLWYRQSLCGG